MALDSLKHATENLTQQGLEISSNAKTVQELAQQLVLSTTDGGAGTLSPFMIGLTVFVLAIFIGYYVVWRVSPALHSPLMAVTNAISSVIIVGALIAAGLPLPGFAKFIGFIAVTLASINIFGGFLVTHRMLKMFQKK